MELLANWKKNRLLYGKWMKKWPLILQFDDMVIFDSCGFSQLQRSMFATPELTLLEGYPSVFCIKNFKFRIQGHVGSRMFQVFTQYTI